MPSERELFVAALERELPYEREAYLHEVCGDDFGLLERLKTLIAAHEASDEFMLQSPLLGCCGGAGGDSRATHGAGNDSSVSSPSKILSSAGREPELAAGTVVGRYCIEKEVGRGGMATVYLATDTRLHRRVAIKIPRSDVRRQPDLMERFEREARTMASVHHRHLCTVHDIGEHDSVPYLSISYLEGPTLAFRLEQGEPFTPPQIAELMCKLAEATERAHSAGVVHRDLKPANVMFDGDGEPVILDFGLAFTAPSDSRLTHAGFIMGTPAYMAPEQALGAPHQVGAGSDIYSLGAILYELLAGRPIYQGNTPAVLGQLVAGEAVPPPSRLRSDVDPTLERICLKAISRQPHQRFESAAAFADALRRYVSDGPERNQPSAADFQGTNRAEAGSGRVTPARRSQIHRAFGVLLALCLIAATFLVAYRFRAPLSSAERKTDSIRVIERAPAPSLTHATPATDADSPLVSADYRWSPPVNLGSGVNTEHNEENTTISADGLILIFNRSRRDATPQIWESRRNSVDEPFGAAVVLPEVINAPGFTNDCPFLSADGRTLWFASNRPPAVGASDLWMSQRDSTTAPWREPVILGPSVNTTAFEQSPYVSDDGLTLLFSRRDPQHFFRMLQSTRASVDESFGEARLVENVNAGDCSSFPRLTQDGRTMVFVHCPRGAQTLQLCAATRGSRVGGFSGPQDLGSLINDDVCAGPSLLHDGRTLIYSSRRAGGAGGFDLWLSTRVRREAKLSSKSAERRTMPSQGSVPVRNRDKLLGMAGAEPELHGFTHRRGVSTRLD